MREKNFEFVFWPHVVFVFCLLFFSFPNASNSDEDVRSRQTYVIRYKDGEQTIPVTVVLDYKKQTEYVINMNPRTPAKSVTLYDFKQRTIAYKDLTNRECFLGRLTHETLNEEDIALQDVKNPVEVHPKVRSLDPRKPALTPTEIRNIAGQKTAVFCRKMNTWLLMPDEKSHNIGKRDVDDEYEERTLQYHGHRSSQYSHYERETRRRLRNGGQASSSRRRSHRKQSEAGNRNDGLPYPESSANLPKLSHQSPSALSYSNPGHPNNINDASSENHLINQRLPQTSYSYDQEKRKNDKENHGKYLQGRFPSETSDLGRHFGYQDLPNPVTRSPSFNANPTHAKSTFNQSDDFELNPDSISGRSFSKNTYHQHKYDSPPERLTLDDLENTGEEPTTTNVPFISHGQSTYPNVHSSLVHLLPVYKPLSAEFDFEEVAGAQNPQPDDQERNIESEGDPSTKAFIEPNYRLNRVANEHDTHHDPDVSINVLEIPRITKEFENLNKSFAPLLSESGNSKQTHTSIEHYPSISRTPVQSNHLHYPSRTGLQPVDDTQPNYSQLPSNNVINKAVKESHFSENRFYNPYSEFTTTTELPVLTTPKYSTAERTTPGAFYIPPIHTAFKNSEDIDGFQIYPNFIENEIEPVVKTDVSAHATRADRHKFKDEDTRIPQHLILTTQHPFREKKIGENVNHRSDIPNEDIVDQLQLNTIVTDKQKNSFPSIDNPEDENVPSYNKRYQSILQDFKPDEILIDIGNVQTHTPPPFTASFHQRIFTTIQPTIKSSSPNETRKYGDRRSEQNSGASWRSLYPPTRYPRRRLHDKPRRPIQNTSLLPTQRGSLNQNYFPAPRVSQFAGVNHFTSVHQRNHRQFYSPGRPIPPSHTRIPAELNDLEHISHLGNLPPGVSVHPRHPQAPLADMVHSNRPPTIPLSNGGNSLLKPHRQRHHRRKEKHLNSCCRLRGQSSAHQSCCRNGGGTCCPRSRRRMYPPGAAPCCSSSNTMGQIISPNQIHPPIASPSNQVLPPLRTEKIHESEMDKKDRCQKEKMCRTLYESTQQVMVCRNADVEGC